MCGETPGWCKNLIHKKSYITLYTYSVPNNYWTKITAGVSDPYAYSASTCDFMRSWYITLAIVRNTVQNSAFPSAISLSPYVLVTKYNWNASISETKYDKNTSPLPTTNLPVTLIPFVSPTLYWYLPEVWSFVPAVGFIPWDKIPLPYCVNFTTQGTGFLWGVWLILSPLPFPLVLLEHRYFLLIWLFIFPSSCNVFCKKMWQLISRDGFFYHFRGIILCNAKRLQFHWNKKTIT